MLVKKAERTQNKWRPSIGIVLFTINLLIVLLPIAGFLLLRIYESSLIRQTESALASQAAFIGAVYTSEMKRRDLSKQSLYRHSLALPEERETHFDPELTTWRPHIAALDLADDQILPRLSPLPVDPVSAAVPKWQRDIARFMQPILRDAQTTTLSAMRVLDTKGNLITTTSQTAKGNYSNYKEVQEALKGQSYAQLRARNVDERAPLTSISRNASVRVYFAAPLVFQNRILGVVLLWRTPPDIFQALFGKRFVLLWAFVALILLTLLISLFTRYTIRRPIRAVEQQARAAAKGQSIGFSMIEHPTTKELASLSYEVATMAKTLDQRSSYLRDLSARISHEFKSPLTALKGSIELLSDAPEDSMPKAQQQKFLSNMEGDVNRLSLLVSRLMELAKADNQHLKNSGLSDQVDLVALIDSFVKGEQQRGRNLSFDPKPALSPPYTVPAEVMVSILTNLVDNAFQHGKAESVQVQLHQAKQHLELSIKDNGVGISENNASKVTEPFFTTARSTGGTGLGLAVVLAHCRTLDAAFDLLPNSPTGTIARLRLPLAYDRA